MFNIIGADGKQYGPVTADQVRQWVREGRAKFLTQFPSIALPEVQRRLADPAALDTFERCKLNHAEREGHAEIYALHRDLIKLRRTDSALRSPRLASTAQA